MYQKEVFPSEETPESLRLNSYIHAVKQILRNEPDLNLATLRILQSKVA